MKFDFKKIGADLINLLAEKAKELGAEVQEDAKAKLALYAADRIRELQPLLAQDSSDFNEVMRTEADSALCKMAGFTVDQADRFDAKLRAYGEAAFAMTMTFVRGAIPA